MLKKFINRLFPFSFDLRGQILYLFYFLIISSLVITIINIFDVNRTIGFIFGLISIVLASAFFLEIVVLLVLYYLNYRKERKEIKNNDVLRCNCGRSYNRDESKIDGHCDYCIDVCKKCGRQIATEEYKKNDGICNSCRA